MRTFLDEKVRIVDSGKPIKTASESQGLIQLYNNYCTQKKCLTCSIGKHLMNND